MKSMNKYLSRALALALAFSLLFSLAGCGSAPSPTGIPESSAAGNEESAPTRPTFPSLDPGTVLPTKPSPGTVKAGNLIEGIEPEAVEGKDADSAFISSQYRFAADLLRRSYEEDAGNCLVSPLSVVLALAMTANGAANDTLSQMLDVIGHGLTREDLNAYLYQYVKNLPSSEKAKLAVANSIWLNDKENFSVRDEFLKKDVSWYGADVYKLPFSGSAVDEVNGWVARNTDNMIKEIIDQLKEDDHMLLINAICFDAKWSDPYTEYAVQDASFTRADGSAETVSMMYSSEYEYYTGDDYTGFAKYYEGNGYKFVGILPNKDVGLDRFVAGLDEAKLSSVLSSTVRTKVNAGLPKFSYDYSAGLKPLLEGMGMKNAFVDDMTRPDFADFSLISETNPLYVSDVIHKTFIDVTEAGTRAAAVTAVIVTDTTAMPTEPPKQVILDRPFLFMIVDTATDLPIFIGTVNTVE